MFDFFFLKHYSPNLSDLLSQDQLTDLNNLWNLSVYFLIRESF